MKITRLEARRCLVGEGPVWDAQEQALYYLDIIGQKVHRYDPATETSQTWSTPAAVGAMALRERGGAVLALRTGVHTLDFETGAIELLAKPSIHPRATFNDGKVDRRGRFVFGACDTDFEDTRPLGGIFSLGPDHSVTQLAADIAFSNGPCWSPDGKTFYFSDSHSYATFAYDYDLATGQLANKRLLIDTRPLGGMPDGTTVDRDGLIWMAIYRAGKIAAFRPDGRLERTIDMPVQLAVSVMFGGPDLDLLYVTTIDPQFFGMPADDAAGYAYVIEGLGARGLAEPRYAG